MLSQCPSLFLDESAKWKKSILLLSTDLRPGIGAVGAKAGFGIGVINNLSEICFIVLNRHKQTAEKKNQRSTAEMSS